MIDDYRAIESLIYSYAERVDAGDLEGLADLLAEAVIGVEGQAAGVEGREAIARLFASTVRIYEDGTPRTRHVTTNVIVEVDEARTRAAARSYFTVMQATTGTSLQPIIAGSYRDRFECRDGTWRFVERRFATDLLGDVSHHMLAGSERMVTKDETR